MIELLVVVAFSVVTQAPADARPPPSPPPVEVEADPADPAEPPPPPPPEPTSPVPPPDPTPPAASADYDPPGVSGCVRFGLQWGTGCLAGAALTPLAGIPFVGIILYPLAVGTLVTLVGDMAGQTRGAFFWPSLAYFGAAFVVNSVVGAVVAALTVTNLLVFFAAILASPDNALVALGAYFAGALVIIAIAAVVVAVAELFVASVPALVYALTSDMKRPGDDGSFRFPGFFSPNHPPATSPKKADARLPAAPAYASARMGSMAY